jgi:pheromone shutdown protein TraB
MNKIVLKNGLFGSSIVTALLLSVTFYMKANPEKEVSMFFGFAGMLLAFIFVVLGIKQQRDTNNGFISLGKAFLTGFWITLIISTIYVVVWLIIFYNFFPNFAEHYTDMAIAKASPDEVAKVTEEMNSFKEMYKNPIMVILLTYMEILPLGIVFSLISALILKKKQIN